VVGLGDYLTKEEITFTLLYLAPVAFVAWTVSRRAAVSLALFSSVTWLLADLVSRTFKLHPAVHAFNFGIQLGEFLAFGILVSALRSRLERELQYSSADPLTGLRNHRAFHAAARLEIERSRRFHLPFSVAYFDVDRFKRINDQFGHVIGDHVLQTLADAVQGSVRQIDLVARLGGDEFVVLLPGTDAAGADVAMAKLRARLDAARWPGAVRVTCSIGCVTFVSPPTTVDELIAEADLLMYEAKRHGGDQCRHGEHVTQPLPAMPDRRAAE